MISEKLEQHRGGDYRTGRISLANGIIGLFSSVLAFRERMTGSEWAEKYGWIPKGTGAESGPITLYGYQRGLLDAMCDPRIPLVTVCKAARVGYTRLATLAVGYHLEHDPTLCAIAQPTIPDAEDFGSSEIGPMLRETPILRAMMRPLKKGSKQDRATYYSLMNGASVRIVGAASDDAFRRYTARFLFGDEIDGDGWTPGAKTQGDKLKLFWTRGETYWNRKQVRGSTPLLEETSRVAKLWAASDQRRYFVPCPHCSTAAGELAGWQYLTWGGPDQNHGIKWLKNDDGRLDSVWYVGTCGHIIEESHKVWMDARGEWRPTATPKTPGHAGFHLWTGMSLNPNAAWAVIVQEWLEAQDDPATLVQPFVNLRLGRTYKAAFGQEIKSNTFLERREAYAAEVPLGGLFLTAGGDVQAGLNARIEVSVYAWGAAHEAWLIGHFVFMGDPAEPEVWGHVDQLLKRGFTREDGKVMAIQAAAIDSGGHHTAETYSFCNERRARRVWAIKGRSELNGQRTKIWPKEPSSKLGSIWYMLGGNAARDWAYGSLAVEKPGARRVHFPLEPALGSRPIDEEFFDQLTREKRLVHRLGYTYWDKPKVPREVGVCWVYAYAAVCGLEALSGEFVALGRMPGLPATSAPAKPAVPAAAPPSVPAPVQPVPPTPPKPRPGRSQLGRRVMRSSYMG